MLHRHRHMEIGFVYSETMTNPLRARDVLTEMRDWGADCVVSMVYEQDLIRWSKDMQRFYEIVADVGLRSYISLGRYGVVFSGLLMVPSLFTYMHPETVIVREGEQSQAAGEADAIGSRFFQRISCVNHPLFRKYLEQQLGEILNRYQPQGLLFDEPKGLNLPCSCQYCRQARQADESPQEANLRFQVEFLRDLCNEAKAHNGSLLTMMVVGHHAETLLRHFAAVDSLDMLGVEAYWVSRGKDLTWLREWCPTTVAKLAAFGKKTQVWANNWGMPRHQQENLLEAYRLMVDAGPDQLMSFWWWRNSDDPLRVMELTKAGIQYAVAKKKESM